jgi:hypothetical protein
MSARIESAVNRLLARLFQEPALLERLRQDSMAVFSEVGLSLEECTALREGSFAALERIGVHPTLRMHYQLAIRPEVGTHVSIREFLPELLKERRHG